MSKVEVTPCGENGEKVVLELDDFWKIISLEREVKGMGERTGGGFSLAVFQGSLEPV